VTAPHLIAVRAPELGELLRTIEEVEPRALLGCESGAVLLETSLRAAAHLGAELLRRERGEPFPLLGGERGAPPGEGAVPGAELLALGGAAAIERPAVPGEPLRPFGTEAAQALLERRALLRGEALESLVDATDLLSPLGGELAPTLAVPLDPLLASRGAGLAALLAGRSAARLLRGEREHPARRERDECREEEGSRAHHPELPRVSTGSSSMISKSK
jgi:hypothetical protein